MPKSWEILTSVVFRPLLFLMYLLSGWSHRDNRLWVFGSWDGRRFADNSAALFRYCRKRCHPNIRVVWISRCPTIISQLRQDGHEAYHAWSLSGLRVCARAGIFIFDCHTKDINHWLSRGAKRVLLRHGVGALKKIEREIDNPGHRLYRLYHGNAVQRAFWRYLLPWHGTTLDLVIAASRQQWQEAQLSFGVSGDTVAVTGLPRNDMLFGKEGSSSAVSKVYHWVQDKATAGKTVFLYMPTFRDNKQPAFPFSWAALDRRLAMLGAALLAHKHFADVDGDFVRDFDNIMFLGKAMDPYPLFRDVDCLITDYSSVAYDFMLTGKPIIYFIHDFDTYLQKSRGLRFHYDDVTPGLKAHNLESFYEAIEAVTCGEGIVSTDHYRQVLELFHAFRDGRSSERVFEAILRRFTSEHAEIGGTLG